MRRLSLLLLILGFSTSPLLATCDRDEIAIHGRVRTATGERLPGAIVALRGSATMTTSAPDGQFELCVEARRSLVLVATRRGYSAAEHEVDLVTDRSAINLVMHPTGYFEMVDVTARTQVPERQPVAGSLHATSLDILRTAGTYADALRGAQMMPGVSKVDEGAGLFVRGGDVNETATYLDRALVSHPYRLETPSGGFFGTVPPWLISGMSLSTGGFPARYGNALSGVLELESLPRPEQREILLTAGLAAVSGRISLPLGDAAGLRFSGNRSQTRTLFELNNVEQEFSTYPAATDFNLGAYYESDRLGQLDAFAFRQRNEVGVGLETESFQGLLESQDENNGVSLRWRRTLASCCLATLTASHSDYRQTSAAGRLDIAERERGSRLRFDLDTRAGEWTLRLGAEWEETRFRFAGQAPERGGDLAGLEGVRLWQLDFARQRAGAYVELEREFGRFATNLGFRADHVSRQGFGFDPRFAITWTPRPGHRFRFATGIYHQAPEAQLLDQDFGNPDLE
ncbi:MAG: TonB-dependent receptor, partial [Acidobacteriota bacterium]